MSGARGGTRIYFAALRLQVLRDRWNGVEAVLLRHRDDAIVQAERCTRRAGIQHQALRHKLGIGDRAQALGEVAAAYATLP